MTMMPQPSGMMAPPMPQMPPPEVIEQAKLIAEAVTWEEIEPILRTDERRNYNIDIETDSTVFDDAEAEKAQRIEVMGAMTSWMQIALPAIQTNRSLAPLMKELTMFTLGAFKLGRTLEETFEDAFDQIQNAESPPDPEAEKLKAEMAMAQQKHGMEMQKGQAEIQGKQQVAQLTAEGKQGELAVKQQSAQMDMAKQQADMQMAREQAQMQMQMDYAKLQLEREKIAMEREKMQLEMQVAQQQAAIQQQTAQMDMAAHKEKAEIDREQMYAQADATQEQHEMDREQAVFDRDMKQQMAKDKAAQAKKAPPGKA